MAEEEKKETIGKKVDESWKEDIKKEKGKAEEGKEESKLPEADFRSFITGLVMQGFMFMGEIPDPVSKEKQKNPPQAKYIIDTLIMLREKTKGNLTQEEDGLMEGAIHELQVRYLKAVEYI
jgi:hypothetical protein